MIIRGRRSTIAFHTVRASSYPASPGSSSCPSRRPWVRFLVAAFLVGVVRAGVVLIAVSMVVSLTGIGTRDKVRFDG
jgi:hypothetical protein